MMCMEQTIDHLIETGNGEHIFAKAIQGYGRGQVAPSATGRINLSDSFISFLRKKILKGQIL